MIRGVRFRIPNKWASFLQLIFDEISVENYFWLLRDDDVHSNPHESEWLFNQKYYDGLEFERIIAHEKYYILALGLIAFPSESGEDVYDYASFMKSTAEFFVLIFDNIYVNIFAKNEETLKLFEKSANKHEFEDIEYFGEDSGWFDCEWTA